MPSTFAGNFRQQLPIKPIVTERDVAAGSVIETRQISTAIQQGVQKSFALAGHTELVIGCCAWWSFVTLFHFFFFNGGVHVPVYPDGDGFRNAAVYLQVGAVDHPRTV